METIGSDYRPTQGVRSVHCSRVNSNTRKSFMLSLPKFSDMVFARILEFESQNLRSATKDSACEVELWDCAGDFKFEACWPAFLKDSNGVVIVFNPDIPSHLKEIETWHSTFISSQSLQVGQCLLIAHHKPGTGADTSRPQLAPQFNKLPFIHSNLEEDPEAVRQEFHTYLGNVVQRVSESREREEMSIIA
ncbi:intraflagellar transport protein 22 [Clarias magur]|uniref:Intraflagellar transport protein 22 n=1 Tax=Clarias magur TaxID=1594786 RepID=A0A8J4UKG8_CLAMG|nr:intraflagellar transport protein 22 [Clarias magur]